MVVTRNLKQLAARWLAGVRQRHRWLDVAVRGWGRYQRTEGAVSAVHVAYSAFFSIFPLLFAAVGIFGLMLHNNLELRDRILALRARQVLPGAVLCAVWWGLLKYFGAFYVGRTIGNAGEVFGQLAIVVGLLVFINLAAQLLMLTASVQAEVVLGPRRR